jgi:hypothetical protein
MSSSSVGSVLGISRVWKTRPLILGKKGWVPRVSLEYRRPASS